MSYTIREATPSDIPGLVDIIRAAFQDVAVRFGLTVVNCQKHPSNCRPTWVINAMERGVRYFVLDSEGVSCGCVALEEASPDVCYIERLAVLPRQRRRGFGRALVERVFQEAKLIGARRIEIGIIADHTELRDWYRKIGFADQKTAAFPHLPFEVLFMSLALDAVG
jgi:N-acetylglutamate synthase-like GNAT family acetyltransferase